MTAPAVQHRGIITLCVMLATIMQALDSTIANVALPYMQGSLGASIDQVNWVLTSYIVAAAIMTPPTGWLAARFGRTRLFVVAVIGFTVASLLCGAAQNLPQMVGFRLLQGLFGASLVPLSQAVLLDINPREKHGQAMAMWGVGVMLGPILGPTLGGWLTEAFNWRYVFYINLPIGILTAIGLARYLKDPEGVRPPKLDVMGFLLLSLAIGSLQMMFDRGHDQGWFESNEIILEAALGGLALYMFLVHIATVANPFVNTRIFTDRNFATGCVFIFIVGTLLFSTMALVTPYIQTLMGHSVLDTGLIMAPRGIGTMAAMMLVGRIIARTDPRLPIFFGLLFLIVSLWQMSGYTPDVSTEHLIVTGLLQGFGLGLVFVPLSTIAFATLSPADRTDGSALFSLIRNIGSSLGISVVSAKLASGIQTSHAVLSEQITPYNPALATPEAIAHWNPMTAAGQAALNAIVTREATIQSYIADYKMMTVVAICALPLVFFLRRPAHIHAEPAAAAMAD